MGMRVLCERDRVARNLVSSLSATAFLDGLLALRGAGTRTSHKKVPASHSARKCAKPAPWVG
jgi:hypothetical protein